MLVTGKVFGWWLFSMLCMKTSFLKNILNSIAMLIFLNFSQIDLLSFHPSITLVQLGYLCQQDYHISLLTVLPAFILVPLADFPHSSK